MAKLQSSGTQECKQEAVICQDYRRMLNQIFSCIREENVQKRATSAAIPVAAFIRTICLVSPAVESVFFRTPQQECR